MEYPLVVNDVLPASLYLTLQDDLRWWECKNHSRTYDPLFWGREQANELIFYDVQTYVKFKIKKHLQLDLIGEKVHLNAATSGQKGSVFHTDSCYEDRLTFVLYTAMYWNTQWGGETVISTPDGYKYVPYIPNRGCLFPSHWEHYGASPNANCDDVRTSVAFTFKVCYN